MIKIATFTGEPIEEGSELDKMFRARGEVFRDRMGWAVEVRDGLEIDRYDRTEDPLYLLAYNNDILVGSLRLLPTTGETMLTNEFASMFDEPVDIRGATAWECTRFCVHPAARSFQGTSRELLIGLCELALKSGIQAIVGLYDDRMTRIYRRIGWTPSPLARSKRTNETLIVGLWDVSKAALATMRAREAETRGRDAA